MKNLVRLAAMIVIAVILAGSNRAQAGVVTAPLEKKVLDLGGKDNVTYARLLGITRKQARRHKVTAVSSDISVVFCDNEMRRVYAENLGRSVITLSVDDSTFDVTVTVRKNADKVLFGRDFAGDLQGKIFEAGAEYELSLPRSIGSLKTDTDQRRLKITNSKGKDVTEKLAKSIGDRLWSVKFTSEGEYTIIGEAFQSDKKPETTASEKIVVTVVAAPLPFSAAPSGMKTIKVTGNGFTTDTVFTVKRGLGDVVIVDTEVGKDGSSAVLTLENRIGVGTYTVSDGVNTSSFEGEDERLDKIVIFEDQKEALTSEDRKSVFVHYDLLNQYGESSRRHFSVNWTSSCGNLLRNDIDLGMLEFRDPSGNGFIYGSQMVLTGVCAGSGISATAQFSCGFMRYADTVNILGIVDLQTKKTVKKIPSGFKNGEYGICFTMLDKLGFEMEYNSEAAENITVTGLDPLVAGIGYEGSSLLIDGKEYGYAVIEPGYYAKNGGKASVRFISNKTGGVTDYSFKLSGGQILDSFNILPYNGVLAEVYSDDDAYTLDFEALDADGEPVTEFRDLVGAVALSGRGLKLVENNDGTASLKYVTGNLGATDKASVPVYLSATVLSSGKVSGLMVDVKEKRRPVEVRSMIDVAAPYVVNAGNFRIYKAKNSDYSYLTYYDQYGEALTSASGYQVKVKSYDTSVISGIRTESSYFRITAKNGAVSRSDTTYIEFALYDSSNNEIPGSSKKIALGILDISAFGSFALSCSKSYKLKNNEDTASFSVKGLLSDGTKVSIPEKYVRFTIPGHTIGLTRYAETVSTGAALSWTPAYSAGSSLPGDCDPFIDHSLTNPDGTHPDIFVETRIEARICRLTTGGAIDLSMPVGSASMVKETGNFERKVTKLNYETSASKLFPVTWISSSKKKAYISANAGVITAEDLLKVLKRDGSTKVEGTDNYGKTKTILNTDIIIEISGYKENTDALYTYYNSTVGSCNIVSNAVAATPGTRIINAEIGDKFTAVYRYGEVSLEVAFTVGADRTAVIDESSGKPEWY